MAEQERVRKSRLERMKALEEIVSGSSSTYRKYLLHLQLYENYRILPSLKEKDEERNTSIT